MFFIIPKQPEVTEIPSSGQVMSVVLRIINENKPNHPKSISKV